jgi:hypothetical protein
MGETETWLLGDFVRLGAAGAMVAAVPLVAAGAAYLLATLVTGLEDVWSGIRGEPAENVFGVPWLVLALALFAIAAAHVGVTLGVWSGQDWGRFLGAIVAMVGFMVAVWLYRLWAFFVTKGLAVFLAVCYGLTFAAAIVPFPANGA